MRRLRGIGALDLVGRVLYAIGAVVAVLLVIGILLVVLDANPDNGLVSFFIDIADFLAGPFENMFTLDDRDAQTAVNWGIAAAVYLFVAALIAGVLGRLTAHGRKPE